MNTLLEGSIDIGWPVQGKGVWNKRAWYLHVKYGTWTWYLAQNASADPLSEPGFVWGEPTGTSSEACADAVDEELAWEFVQFGIRASNDPLTRFVCDLQSLRTEAELQHAWHCSTEWRALAALARESEQALAVRQCLASFGILLDEVFVSTPLIADCESDEKEYALALSRFGNRSKLREAAADALRTSVRCPTLATVREWAEQFSRQHSG